MAIELGSGGGAPPVGGSPSIILPTVVPSPPLLIGTDPITVTDDPIPIPDYIPADGVILLETPSTPDYSGVNRLIEMLDVQKTRAANNVLYYEAVSETYYHADIHSLIDFPVDSVFGRTEDVIAVYGDYAAELVTFAPSFPMISTNVQDAIDEVALTYAKSFLELDDTPSDYIGQAGRYATVNGGETGLEFVFVATVNYDPVTDTYYLPPTTDGQIQNIGQEIFINCVDESLSGTTASNPKVFMIVGTNVTYPNFLNVSKPIASSIPKGVPFGLNTVDIDGVTGKFKLVTYGYVNNVDTSAWSLGDLLWVDPTTPGEMTNVEPPENPYAIGIVAIEDSSVGSIFVSTIYPIGASGQNIAGVVHQDMWFTADVASGAPTFYAVKLQDEGTGGSLQLSVIVDDNQTLPLPDDFLTDVYPVPQRFFQGTYNGKIEAEVDDSSANEIFTIEIYLTDSAGAVIDSGISEESVGDLGVRPLTTLDSGIRNMSGAQRYEIDVTGVLREEITIGTNQRLRAHILCTKLGTEGAAKTFDVYTGNLHNTFLRVPPTRVLNDNADVNISSPVITEVLTFDGTHWVNAPGGAAAIDVSYDNTTSGLAAINVQDAIDEVDGIVDSIVGDYVDLSTNQTVAGEKTWSDLAKFTDDLQLTNLASTTTTFTITSSAGGTDRTLIQQSSSRFSFTMDTGVEQFVINEAGRDIDTRIESDLDANAFYLQGSDGFLGLGTATPLYKLDVLGNARINSDTTAVIKINSNALVGVARSFIQLTRGLAPEDGWDFSSNLSQANDELTFRSIASSVATSRLTILQSGNVGIGITAPTTTLHVVGDAIITALPSDDTEDHVITIDDTTGLLSKRAVSTIFNNLTGQVTSVGLVTTLSTTAITDWTTPASLTGGENFLVEFSGTLYEMPQALIDTYLNANLNFNLYVHPNHSGQVTSVADGAQTLTVNAITDWTIQVSLNGNEHFLVENAGTLYEVPMAQISDYYDLRYAAIVHTHTISDITDYVAYVHPNHSGQVSSVGDGAQTLQTTAITDWSTPASFTGGENFLVEFTGTLYEMPWALMETYLDGIYVALTGAQSIAGVKTFTDATIFLTVTTDTLQIEDGTTTIVKDGSNNMVFTDAITGSKTLAELATTPLSLGTVGQMPYMNAGGTDFSYSASLHYTTGIFNAPNISVAAIAAASTAQLVTTAVATGALGTDQDLTWDGTILTVIDGTLASDTLDLKNTGVAPVGIKEGRLWWNEAEYTLNIDTGLGPVLQTGQEMFLLIYNDTISTITNFTVLRPLAATLIGGLVIPTVQKANASTWLGVEGTIMVATMDIPPSSVGLAVRFGRARGGDGSGTPYGEVWSPGDQLYVSEIDGELTNVRPEFPAYNISIGGAIDTSIAPDGEIFVSITRNFNDTFDNFWNGVIRESFTFAVTEAIGVVTGTLTDQEGNGVLTYLFEDGFYLKETTPAVDIVLTAGTDTVPVTNYVYILESTKALTLSTVAWPVVEHIKVAVVVLRSATATGTDGAIKNQNWNDHLQSTDGQGHLSHIGHKLRNFEAQWDSGTLLTYTYDAVPVPDSTTLQVTSGVVFQMHKQAFPAFDTSAGDVFHVINHFTTPYVEYSDLNQVLDDAQGNTLNNTSFSFVIWGIQNSGSEPCHLMLNLPTDSYSYTTPDIALNDPNNYSVFTIPKQYQGVGFLIARITATYKNNVWVIYDNEDLRGKIPNTTAGGGGGGGTGATTFLGLTDTPATYIGEALKIPQVNAGETALEFTNAPTITTLYFNDVNTYIDESASELQFTDTVNGSVLLSAMISSLSVGTDGQIPYVNPAGNDFLYSSALKYALGVFYADGGITVSSLAAVSNPQVLTSAVATGVFETQPNLVWTGTQFLVGGDFEAIDVTITGNFIFSGFTITALETVLTNNDAIIPTSGAVFDAIAAVPTQILSLGAAQYHIPYTNAGLDDFDYTSGFRYDMGVLYASNITIPALAATTTPQIVLTGVATGVFSTSTGLTFDGTTLKVGTAIDVQTIDNSGGNLTVGGVLFTTSGNVYLATTNNLYFNVAGTVKIYETAGVLYLDDTIGGPFTLAQLNTDTVYVHPNHTGQVTSVADGAQTLTVNAITDWTTPAGFTGGENFLVEFSGTLYEMPITLLETYLNVSLLFNNYSHPNHTGQVTSIGDGAQVLTVTAITAQGASVGISATDTFILADTGVLVEATITQLETYMQSNLSFSTQTLALGTNGQIPYMNSGGTDFSYSSAVTYITGTVTVPALAISSKAIGGGLLYSVIATGVVTQSSNLTFDGTTLDVTEIALTTGATVDTIEATLTNDCNHIATSSAIFIAIATASQWTTDTNGITYAGNVGIGVASSASIGLFVDPDAGDSGIATYSNYTFAAWVDYPITLPNRAITLSMSSDVSQFGLNAYSAISLHSRGSSGHNAYVVLACQSLSTVNQSSRFNILLRGAATSDYETILSFDYNSVYNWKVDSTSGSVTHKLVQNNASKFTFGYDHGRTSFTIAPGSSFPTGAGATISAPRVTITSNSKLFVETKDTAIYSATVANAASSYIYNTYPSALTTTQTNLQMRLYNGGTYLPIVQLITRPLNATSNDTIFTITLRTSASYLAAFEAQSDGIFYIRSEGTAEDIRVRYAQQAGGIVCTTGWDDGTASYEIAIGTSGNFGTAPRYNFDTNIFTMYGTSSAAITIDAATSTAILYLQAHTDQDARIHFRENTSTQVVAGWDGSASIFQIHTSTGFTTLAAGDFSITTTGDIYMGTLASATGTYYMRYNTTTGQVSYTTSDIRNKKEIKPFEVDALDALMKFDPKRFTWRADNKKAIGWIAQEGMKVIPDMFPFIEKIDRYGMDEFNILPYYHKAIQQLKAEIDDLRAQLNNN